ncbi:E3 SUMO-protein ligase PIAS2-like [Brevipalpus obovatus]|uniref:E3 SUMO-protein ligase PIAS2-like n=1 Tax=Brevipalpus obovatus TaxID=246614 RepID=UPI003D9E45FD
MSDVDFPNQDCVVFLTRIPNTIIEQHSRQNSIVLESSEEEEEESFTTRARRKMSGPASRNVARMTRKRTGPSEDDNYSKYKGASNGVGTTVIKKARFEFDPDKYKLVFSPLNDKKYDHVHTLVPPTFSDTSSDHCLFPLSRSQSKKINLDNYCVLLRLSYFNKTNDPYDDIFDYGMDIKINDISLPLTQATEEDENAPIEGPADISRYLVADGNTIEKIKISFDGSAKPHIFSVVLARKTKDELPIVPMRYSDPNLTFKLFMRANERITNNNPSPQVFRRIYPLTDPITEQRIEIPVRGQVCTHVECFDKNAFLRRNRRKVTWHCPVCEKTLKEDQLVVDGLFVKILSATYTSCKAVEMDSQGGWSPVYREKVFRTRLVDLENDYSEGEDDVDESPLSPIDIPPQPVDPEPEPETASGIGHISQISNQNGGSLEDVFGPASEGNIPSNGIDLASVVATTVASDIGEDERLLKRLESMDDTEVENVRVSNPGSEVDLSSP